MLKTKEMLMSTNVVIFSKKGFTLTGPCLCLYRFVENIVQPMVQHIPQL